VAEIRAEVRGRRGQNPPAGTFGGVPEKIAGAVLAAGFLIYSVKPRAAPAWRPRGCYEDARSSTSKSS